MILLTMILKALNYLALGGSIVGLFIALTSLLGLGEIGIKVFMKIK